MGCPCLVGKDMFEHIGESGMVGCVTSCFCPMCFQCYMGPKIAEKSDIKDETMWSSILKTICPCTSPCYTASIGVEYMKQKKLNASNDTTSGKGQWMVTIKDQYYFFLCPCLVGKEMFEHVNKSGMLGCFLSIFLTPCFLCIAGQEIAKVEEIPETCGQAVLKTLFPCTSHMYGTSIYVEYMYQKQLGLKAKPAQMEMQ